MADERPLLPDYDGACISNIVPALLEPGQPLAVVVPGRRSRMPTRSCCWSLDGLGWNQLQARTPVRSRP